MSEPGIKRPLRFLDLLAVYKAKDERKWSYFWFSELPRNPQKDSSAVKEKFESFLLFELWEVTKWKYIAPTFSWLSLTPSSWESEMWGEEGGNLKRSERIIWAWRTDQTNGPRVIMEARMYLPGIFLFWVYSFASILYVVC